MTLDEFKALLDERIVTLRGKSEGWEYSAGAQSGSSPFSVALNELLALRIQVEGVRE